VDALQFVILYVLVPPTIKIHARDGYQMDYSLQNIVQNVTRYMFRWAVSTVMTRQNQIPSTETGEVDTALIPLWDMCNHTNGWVCLVHL